MSMSSTATSLATSLLLMLAAYPLISLGSQNGIELLMWIGVALLAIGGVIPLVRKFVQRNQPSEPPDQMGMPEDVRC